MDDDLQCWNCAASLRDLPRPVTRHMNCPKCFEDLHCCRMCRHFLDNATDPCADERADPPTRKESANFCDFFQPSGVSYRTGANERRVQAKSNLDALFDDGADRAFDDAPGERKTTAERSVSENDSLDRSPTKPLDENAAARRKLEDLFR